jgi:predicted ABC-type sugar transport system permease subunit
MASPCPKASRAISGQGEFVRWPWSDATVRPFCLVLSLLLRYRLGLSQLPHLSIILLGGLCGLAGVLQSARAFGATAQLGDGLELDVIAAMVVGGTPLTGGIGSIQGTILGAFITTVLSNGMNMLGVDAYLQSLARGIVLITAVFVTIDRSKIGIIK